MLLPEFQPSLTFSRCRKIAREGGIDYSWLPQHHKDDKKNTALSHEEFAKRQYRHCAFHPSMPNFKHNWTLQKNQTESQATY